MPYQILSAFLLEIPFQKNTQCRSQAAIRDGAHFAIDTQMLGRLNCQRCLFLPGAQPRAAAGGRVCPGAADTARPRHRGGCPHGLERMAVSTGKGKGSPDAAALACASYLDCRGTGVFLESMPRNSICVLRGECSTRSCKARTAH